MTFNQAENLEYFCHSKTIVPDKIEEKVAEIRAQGKTIATLNGSFDLLHAGHLHILYEASKSSDVLIVALNSDTSIKAYKSADRPIIPLHYRMKMMAALQFIDYVTWFEETTPITLLKKIKPDVHINGSDYGENCIEAETVKAGGGRIQIVPLLPSLSTSDIIKKIHSIESKQGTPCA